MRSVKLTMHVAGVSAAAAFRTLADFGRYPEQTDAVRSVTVTRSDATTTVSEWEVNFRTGILRWTEQDTFDIERCRIDFCQIRGDVDAFEGAWACTDEPSGCVIEFEARLDMGIPSLADALEPIAVRTLVENTVVIVRGLFATDVVVESDIPARRHPRTAGTVAPAAAAAIAR